MTPASSDRFLGNIHLDQSDPLSKRVIRGGLWVFVLRITNQGLAFLRTVVLARLLSPEDFGLFGLAMVAISVLETFSQTGFQAALVRKREDVESYLDTAWTFSFLRGTVLFIVLFLSAPLVADFFNSPHTILIIKIIAINTLLSGTRNIGIILFQKDLEFKKQFYYECSAALVDLFVAVALALLLHNVWALVWGGLAANTVRLLMSYRIHPYRPRLGFDRDKLLEMIEFGKWVLGSGILVFLITQGDDIFVGKILGVTALGLYQMAYMISNLPVTQVNHVVSQVTFPAYAILQDNLPKLRVAYMKVLQLTLFFSFPLGGGILVLAPELTSLFLGPKWMPIVPITQVLLAASLLRSIAATTGRVFYALGKTKLETGLQCIRLLILATLIYPFSMKWGLMGISLSVLLSIFLSTIGFSFFVVQLTECSPAVFVKMIFVPLLNTAIAATVLWCGKTLMGPGILPLVALVILGPLIYFGCTLVWDRSFHYPIRALISEIWTWTYKAHRT